jgi:hypothetical protein
MQEKQVMLTHIILRKQKEGRANKSKYLFNRTDRTGIESNWKQNWNRMKLFRLKCLSEYSVTIDVFLVFEILLLLTKF